MRGEKARIEIWINFGLFTPTRMSIYAKKNEQINLTGKTSCVSGGTTGIGAALAKRFSEAGANVFVIGRNKERGDKVIEELKRVGRAGAKYEFIQADLRSVSFLFSSSSLLSMWGLISLPCSLFATIVRRLKSRESQKSSSRNREGKSIIS